MAKKFNLEKYKRRKNIQWRLGLIPTEWETYCAEEMGRLKAAVYMYNPVAISSRIRMAKRDARMQRLYPNDAF